jgi:hypothetical protein
VLTDVDDFRGTGVRLVGQAAPGTAARGNVSSTQTAELDSVRVTLRRLDLMAIRLIRRK